MVRPHFLLIDGASNRLHCWRLKYNAIFVDLAKLIVCRAKLLSFDEINILRMVNNYLLRYIASLNIFFAKYNLLDYLSPEFLIMVIKLDSQNQSLFT